MNGKEDKVKKRKGKSRVAPTRTGDGGDLHEMEEKQPRNNKSTTKMFQMGGMDKNKLNVISNIEAGKYVTSKRKTTAQGKL
ncbi:hypothetical protein NP493_1462g00067 [Ridgeia piscesae]|uniref:Uncharacterized protein n=1 Tax=Ridgeia piscesae TaxID=27915 RepID=A0AAD9K3J5_RIDPI|nr:hypothetical protein NP493_1462g00067 [Ridgeia piscesae]